MFRQDRDANEGRNDGNTLLEQDEKHIPVSRIKIKHRHPLPQQRVFGLVYFLISNQWDCLVEPPKGFSHGTRHPQASNKDGVRLRKYQEKNQHGKADPLQLVKKENEHSHQPRWEKDNAVERSL